MNIASERGDSGHVYDEFRAGHGVFVRVQRSTDPAAPHVWVFCADTDGESVPVLLGKAGAMRLRDALNKFIRE